MFRGLGVLDSTERVLTKIFWVAAPVLAALLLVYSFSSGVVVGSIGEVPFLWLTGVLMVVVMFCSGFITWNEFRKNPIDESERGEWTGRQLFHAIVFVVTFMVAFVYLPALYFGQ